MASVSTWADNFRSALNEMGANYQRALLLAQQYQTLGWDADKIRAVYADGGDISAEDMVAAVETVLSLMDTFAGQASVLAKMRP